MVTGGVLFLFGLFNGVWGATRFNFGHMISGWALAGAGALIFVVSFVRLP